MADPENLGRISQKKPELSEADKARIRAEEEYRAQVRTEIGTDAKKSTLAAPVSEPKKKPPLKTAAQIRDEQQEKVKALAELYRQAYREGRQKEIKSHTFTRPEQTEAWNLVRRENLTPEQRAKEDKRNVWMFGTLLAIIVVTGGITLRACGGDMATQRAAAKASRERQAALAKTLAGQEPSRIAIACEESVKGKLKAPSTAKFPTWDLNKLPFFSGNSWNWNSYVDAENSFGAKIRTEFVCTVTGTTPDNAVVQTTLIQ